MLLANLKADKTSGFDNPGTTPPAMTTLNLGNGLPLPPGAPAPQTPLAIVYGANRLSQSWTWSATNRVNFICHSQGGTTVRYLLWLLSGAGETNLPHFLGVDRRPWVKAVVTLGTPHNGTPVTQVIEDSFIRGNISPVVDFITSCSFADRQDRFYDLHLDHWGFARRPLESYENMRARIAADVHAWWYNNLTSNGFRDNSIAGASYLNNIESGLLHPIYFFTMSFCATQPFPELSLTGQDVNEFLDLFIPVHRILDPFGFWAWVVPQIEPLTRRLGLTPSFQAVLSFATDVANRHLGSLGYFSRIPRPGSQIPRPDVLPVLAFFAYAMGGVGNHRFRQNDGVVSTASMDGPHGGRMPINNAGGRFAAELDQHGPARMKGIYWNFGSNSTIDHADQIGVFTDPVTTPLTVTQSGEVEIMYKLFAELMERISG